MLLAQLIADTNLNSAFAWLCRQRVHFPANADIWHLRAHQATRLPAMQAKLADNQYNLTPLELMTKRDGTRIALWSSEDALVLKMLTQVLQPLLPCHRLCVHSKGHGGSKRSIQVTHDRINSGRFVFVLRTDIKGYYAQINKHQLLAQLAAIIPCKVIINLLSQYLFYSVEEGGNFHTPDKGISRGCALSPLMASFQLYCMDAYFAKQKQLRYQRYMDDFLILCQSHNQLRQAVRQLNQFFTYFGFKQHPDKTFIGKIAKGFDWLGFQFNQTGVISVSARTLDHYVIKLHQLYEQARGRISATHEEIHARVVAYGIRWRRWSTSGLHPNIVKRLANSVDYASP